MNRPANMGEGPMLVALATRAELPAGCPPDDNTGCGKPVVLLATLPCACDWLVTLASEPPPCPAFVRLKLSIGTGNPLCESVGDGAPEWGEVIGVPCIVRAGPSFCVNTRGVCALRDSCSISMELLTFGLYTDVGVGVETVAAAALLIVPDSEDVVGLPTDAAATEAKLVGFEPLFIPCNRCCGVLGSATTFLLVES